MVRQKGVATPASDDDQRRLIIEAAANAMLVIDVEGVIRQANAEAERIFGYAPGGLDGVPALVLQCAAIGPDAASPHNSGARTDPLRGSVDGNALTARRADGTTIAVETSARSIAAASGRLTLVTISNVRERRAAVRRRHSPAPGASRSKSEHRTSAQLPAILDDDSAFDEGQRERERLGEYVELANQSGKVGFWELDLRTNASAWDRNMYALYGIADRNRIPSYEMWQAALHPHDRERAALEIKDDIADGTPSDTEYRVIWENGEIHRIRSLATIIHDAAGTPVRIIGTDWDVTELRNLAEQLRAEKEALIRSEARYRALTEAMPQLVWVIDASARFEYVNDRWSEYTGLTEEGSAAAGFAELVHADDRMSSTAALAGLECELRLRRADGEYRWHLVRTVPFADASGHAGKWMSTATDIQARKNAENLLASSVAELDHLAHHDAMTGLPNRTLLMNRLSSATSLASRAQSRVIVLYIDLDRFKTINDVLGHAAGDHVLKETAQRINGALRNGDTASRVGGDEFVVVCASGGRADDAAAVAARFLSAVRQPIEFAGKTVLLEASVGSSVYPADGTDSDALIRKADVAMYAAKQSGGNAIRVYSDQAHMSLVAAAEFETELREAIASGQLVAYYQPIVDLAVDRVVGAEALVRWQHPQRGLLPPGAFIDFAQERGLITQIGEVMLHSACAELARLALPADHDFRISVNVAPNQFGTAGFVDSVSATLAHYGVAPRRLCIEITETVVMGNTEATIATLRELRALGVALSIDDFGTGYSSLAYIKEFPIHTLKIDRSFVRDVADDATDQAIAKTIITLAHSLGMNVIAEGVETQAQLERLRSFGADRIQGFLFSCALPAAEFERYIFAYPQRESPAA